MTRPYGGPVGAASVGMAPVTADSAPGRQHKQLTLRQKGYAPAATAAYVSAQVASHHMLGC